MSKIKLNSFFTALLAVAVIISLASFARAKAEQGQGQNQEVNQQQNQEQNQGEETMNQEQNQAQEQEQNLISQQEGQINAEEHRSTVANFVQSLLKVASSTGGGIGEQVRLIAQQQNLSATTTIRAMEKVQTRSKVKTFFFGSDYKNLGVLRSETVQTRNRIEQLNRVIQNATDTAGIQAQIQTLEEEQARIENFIKEQESKFSLFGWLVKFFNR